MNKEEKGRKRTEIGNGNAAGRREKASRKIGQSRVRKTRSTDPGQPEPRTRESQPVPPLASAFGPAQLQRPKPQTGPEATDQLNQPKLDPRSN